MLKVTQRQSPSAVPPARSTLVPPPSKIRRPFGSGRVDPSSKLQIFESSSLQIFKCSNLQIFKISFLPFFLPFFFSSFLPNLLPSRGEVYFPPYPPPGHQLENLFRTRTSSEPTFFDVNFHIDLDDILVTYSPPKAPEVDPKTSQNGFKNKFQNQARINMGNSKKIMKIS